MISILQKTDSPLLARTEIKAEMSFRGATPSRKDIKKELASNLNSKEELVVVRRINSVQGQQKVTIEANVYSSEKDLKKTEPAWALQRGGPKKKKEEETEKAPEKEEKKEPEEEKQEKAPEKEEKKEPEEEKEQSEKNIEEKETPKEEKPGANKE